MGFGIAASIGALHRRRPPKHRLRGWGRGFQFNIQELETVSRLQLPIKFFVLNNNGYASIRASQTSFSERPASAAMPPPDKACPIFAGWRKLTASRPTSSGIRRISVRKSVEFCAGRARWFAICIAILDETRQPRLSSFQRPDGSFVSKPLEDLWPFLNREEFLSNMLIPALED